MTNHICEVGAVSDDCGRMRLQTLGTSTHEERFGVDSQEYEFVLWHILRISSSNEAIMCGRSLGGFGLHGAPPGKVG